MKMRRSKIFEKTRDGQVAIGIKLNLTDPRIVDLIGAYGYDFIFLCMEHVPNSVETVENQVRAAKMHDMDALVRVRKGPYNDYIYPLEMDAAGIVVPHVTTTDEAKEIVRMTRFHPLGRRAWDGGNADGAFCLRPPDEYINYCNNERVVVIQIEDPEAKDNIEDIAKVDGIDAILFGPGDYSHGLGFPGQYDHPECIEVRKRIINATRDNGKIAMVDTSIEEYPEMVDMGFQIALVSADVIALGKEFGSIATRLGLPA